MVEEKRNILIGYVFDGIYLSIVNLLGYTRLAIFVGFASFFVMEKMPRVLGGEEGHSHSHGHSHSGGTVNSTSIWSVNYPVT